MIPKPDLGRHCSHAGLAEAFSLIYIYIWTSLVAQMVKRLPAMQTHVGSLGWKDPLEKEMATHSITLAWKIPGSRKESNKTEQLHYHFLSIYIILFIYLFWAVLCLPCCADFSPFAVNGASHCGDRTGVAAPGLQASGVGAPRL